MRPPGSPSGQFDLALDWTGSRDPDPGAPADSSGPAPDWWSRLDPSDRRRVAGLARERRALVFLVDDRTRWSLVLPRLPLAGFDALDFQDQPDGDFRIIAFSDTPVRELEHLLKCLRQTRPPRAVACERIAWTGRALASLAHPKQVVPMETPPCPGSAEKNS